MIKDDKDSILMSDSLIGMIPELDGKKYDFDDSFVNVNLELTSLGYLDVLPGSLVGGSFDPLNPQLDIRTNLNIAYEFIKKNTSSRLTCRIAYMHLGDSEIRLEGPYQIYDPKISDIDRQTKTCTLGIELVKLGQ